ncbi:MAG: PEGA domain-containing protein [Pseudomonadota bacterium]|nr:PEGA domain-containing protein [Pseudomonadota bacterium]
MSELIVREALGERRFTATDFPIAVGGQGSAIVMAGRPEGAEAYLGMHEDQLFVQPADGAEVLHNGVRVHSSTWLRSGDVINFGAARLRLAQRDDERVVEVDDGSSGNITAPPIIEASSRMQGGEGDAEHIDALQFRPSGQVKAKPKVTLDVKKIVIGIAAAVVAVVLWFIFTATSVSVRTDPAAAVVAIEGTLPAMRVGDRVLLRPGDYSIKATQPGYSPAQLQAKVTSEPNQIFSLKLQKLPGKVRVDVPTQARVSVDGKELGNAPGEFQLAPGKHTIAIAATRYQPFSGELDVTGEGKSQTFKPQLVPAWAEVTVSSEPAGATLIVAGEERGVTPLTTQILAGNHPLELRLEGFKSWTTDVQVKANEPMNLGPVRLGLPDGKLALRSEPSGASVSVGGVYRGQTPVSLELRPDIAHNVVLTLPGYEAATRSISLTAGESRTLSVPLPGVFGEVTVQAQPADAEVFVNGKSVGAANQKLRLVATTQDIEIRKTGFVTYKASVTPRPGVPQKIETTLLTPSQAKMAATPANIRSKAEQALKLMPLGSFTMGSPRREPGRRANEAQRNVQFKRPFYVSLTEVTNGQFRKFKSEHRSGIVGQHTLDLDNQPAVGVTWQDAALFCNWLSQQDGLPPAYENKNGRMVAVQPLTTGYRLPTDAEWEWVARYQGGGQFRRYPWGDVLPVAPRSGNYADVTARLIVQDVIPDYDDGFAAAAPTGKFPANSLGLFDLGGNVAEWVHDYYTVSSDSGEVAVDPSGPADGKQHVIRGSSWKQSSVTDLRLSARDFGESQRNDLGFRVARYAE